MPDRSRVLVIGLDGVPPEYLFEKYLPLMPNVRRLLEKSFRAPLATTDPPISIPAWPVMFTGMDPGTLGLYGFRHRVGNSYTETYIPDSTQLPVRTVWERCSDLGLRVAAIGMPLSYPPPRLNGLSVSDFLTPPEARVFTNPPELGPELEREFGKYHFDVLFRASQREDLFESIVTMTEQHFRVAEHLLRKERWDLFGVHEIGSDRLNHAYTKYFDDRHPAYVAGNPLAHVAEQYYPVLDTGIGRLLSLVDENTHVLIVSDHGSMPMSGCFCINQWLEERGYLVLRRPAVTGTPLERADVDWSRTTVWGAGGYYARLFFNRARRDPNGFLDDEAVGKVRAQLCRELTSLTAPDGRPLPTEILDPHEIYRMVREGAPDLMAYFGGLKWRSAGTLGHPNHFLKENDTGPDDAVHSVHGVFVAHSARYEEANVLPPQRIIDVTPTILKLLGLSVPGDMQGSAIRLE